MSDEIQSNNGVQVLMGEAPTEVEAVEASGDVGIVETIEEDAPVETESTEESEPSVEPSGDVHAEAQKIAGSIIAKERARLKAKYEAQNKAQYGQSQNPLVPPPEGTVFDTATGEFVSADSVIGQMAIREQKVAARKAQEQAQAAQAEREARYAEAREKINEGWDRYSNYGESFQAFQNLGTDAIAEVLAGADDPAAIINYFGDKQGELKRIASLTPDKQVREIFKLEEAVQTKPNLVTKAKPVAAEATKAPRNLKVGHENMSNKSRTEFWRQHFNARGS